MNHTGVSIQAICRPATKAYKELCTYVDGTATTFAWKPRGKRMVHTGSGNYPGQVELEESRKEVLSAWVTVPSPETIGSFVGLLVRCFGDQLVAVNIQRRP